MPLEKFKIGWLYGNEGAVPDFEVEFLFETFDPNRAPHKKRLGGTIRRLQALREGLPEVPLFIWKSHRNRVPLTLQTGPDEFLDITLSSVSDYSAGFLCREERENSGNSGFRTSGSLPEPRSTGL